jgi:hypothetical protein
MFELDRSASRGLIPRQFSDYDVTLDAAALPAGVMIEEWV